MKRLAPLFILVTFLGCSRTDHQSSDKPADSSALDADSSLLEKGDTTMTADSSGGVYYALTLDGKDMYDIQTYAVQIDESRTEVIDFDCAILIYPTDSQIEALKKQYGEDDFYTVADDNSWYQGQAIHLVDSLQIKTATVQGRYLTLKGQDATWTLDVRRGDLLSWGLIFFHKAKSPIVVSTVDLTFDQVKAYFKGEE